MSGAANARVDDESEARGTEKTASSQLTVSSSTNLTQPNWREPSPLFRPMDLVEDCTDEEKVQSMQRKVSHLTRTMHHNLQALAVRGDDLADLERRAGRVELDSKCFAKAAVKVDRNIWWQQRHFHIAFFSIAGAVLVLILLFILLKQVIPIF